MDEALEPAPNTISECLIQDDTFSLRLACIQLPAASESEKAARWAPVLFHGSERIQRQEKLHLALQALLLAKLLPKAPKIGVIWYGSRGRKAVVKLASLFPTGSRELKELPELLQVTAAPPLFLNDHCNVCEFKVRCRTQALEE